MNKNSSMGGHAQGRGTPTGVMTVLEKGARLYNARRFEEAHQLLAAALAELPDDPGLNSLAGQVALALDQHAVALKHFDLVLLSVPDHPELLSHRAMCLLKLGRKEEAEQALGAILDRSPDSITTLKYLGAIRSDEGDCAKAEGYLRRALAINPDEPEVLCLLGKTLVESYREQEARAVIKRAIKLRPTQATPFNLLGATYRQQCRFRTALSCYRHARRLDPADLASNVNYGVGLLDAGRVHDSIAQYRRYLEVNPACDQARFNLATALLQIGQLEEGWEAYEARRKMHKLRDYALPYPDWQGEPIKDKTILVLAEQGIGDEIWAANMFDDLIGLAGHCIFECEPRLVTLLQRSFPQATIVPRLADAVRYPKERPADVKLPAMSLARWLRTRPEQFPGKLGYLVPDGQRQEYWRWRVQQLGPGLKVGISWRSMNLAGSRNDSYTSLAQWGDILSVPGVHFVNLQYGDCAPEIEAAQRETGVAIHNFRDIDLKDGVDDVAALMGVLDVVIAPDNTVSALAGALNVPVLQFVPSKYWSCHGRDYHPWFPSAKLFFRPWDHTWDQTLRALATELGRLSQQAANRGTTASTDTADEDRLIRTRLQRANLFLLSRQPEKAKNICDEILSLRPRHSEALLLLGAVERRLGHLDRGERALTEAIAIDPLLAEAHNLLGAVRLDSGAIDEAESAFLQALELRPGYPDALNNLGTAFALRGDITSAADYFRRASAALSGFLIARYNLASALMERPESHDEALAEFLTVVEAEPRHPDAWNNLGILYGRLGRAPEAIDAYRKALAARPDDDGIKINLAKQILRGGAGAEEGIALFLDALKTRPDDARLLNALGVAYATQGEFEKARERFQSALELAPDYYDACRNLGIALQRLGRLEEARDVLRRGVALAAERQQPSARD